MVRFWPDSLVELKKFKSRIQICAKLLSRKSLWRKGTILLDDTLGLVLKKMIDVELRKYIELILSFNILLLDYFSLFFE